MNTASLKQDYQERIVPILMKEFNYTTVMQSRQGCRVNTRQNDERTETIDEHEQRRGQQSDTEVLDLPDIFECFDKLHNKTKFSYGVLASPSCVSELPL